MGNRVGRQGLCPLKVCLVNKRDEGWAGLQEERAAFPWGVSGLREARASSGELRSLPPGAAPGEGTASLARMWWVGWVGPWPLSSLQGGFRLLQGPRPWAPSSPHCTQAFPFSRVTIPGCLPSFWFFVWRGGPAPRHSHPAGLVQQVGGVVPAADTLRQEPGGITQGFSPWPRVCGGGGLSSPQGFPHWVNPLLVPPRPPVPGTGSSVRTGREASKCGVCPAQGYCSLWGGSYESNTPPKCGKSNNLTHGQNKPWAKVITSHPA